MDGGLTYNSNSLQTYDRSTKVGINTNKIKHVDMPESVAQLYQIASSSDSVVPDLEYPSKIIKLEGTIHGSSQADLDDRIDTFKGYFAQRNKNLDIVYGSGTRRYTVLKTNAAGIDREDKALFAFFSVELVCKPFGIDTSATSLWATKTGYTSATFTETPTIGGNAPYQLPVFTITINSFTGDGDYVLISNNNNNQEILIYGQSIEAGDVITIDCFNRIVTLNGNEIDYFGTFLQLEPGSASITYTDGFTTRDVDVEGEYTKRWL